MGVRIRHRQYSPCMLYEIPHMYRSFVTNRFVSNLTLPPIYTRWPAPFYMNCHQYCCFSTAFCFWPVNDDGAPYNVTGASPNKGTRNHLENRHRFCLHDNCEAPLLQDAREGETCGSNSDFNSSRSVNGGIVDGYSRTHIGDRSPENSCCWLLAVFQAKLHSGIVESVVATSRKQCGTVYGF